MKNSYYQRKARKKYALEAMRTLSFDERLIKTFDESQSPVLFDFHNLPYNINEYLERDICNAIKQFERKTDCLVYAVIKEGKEPSKVIFLIISADSTEWGEEIELPYVQAYTHYFKNENASEFGIVDLKIKDGKIVNVSEPDYFAYRRIG